MDILIPHAIIPPVERIILLVNTELGGVLKRIRTLLVPYLIFAVFSNLIAFLMNTQYLNEYIKQPWDDLFLGGSQLAVWFLYVLFFVEIGYRLLGVLVKEKLWMFVGSVTLAVISYIMYLQGIHLPYKLEVVGYGMLFYSVGHIIRTKGLLKEFSLTFKWRVLLLLIIVSDVILAYWINPMLDIANNILGMHVLSVFVALAGIIITIIIAKQIQWKPLKWFLGYVGQYSIVVVGLSQVTLDVIKDVFVMMGVPGILGNPLRHVLLWGIMLLAIYAISRYVPFVIGRKKNY